MPLTFIDIERQKNWRIGLFFLVLMLLYIAVTAAFASAFFIGPLFNPLKFWVGVVAISLVVAGIHFWFSSSDTVNTVIRTLDAQPPDPKDDVHKMFSNVMEEIHVVTENRRKIRSAVIPSLSLNALAAADLQGDAVIAVTEGLLSRLTRPQVEAVVAHEAHHILSGDCLETTVAAGIFGTYSAVLQGLTRSPRGRGFPALAVLLAWLLLQLSYLLNLFISREREYRADAASVRMTRNPVALAETLHLLSRGWRGAGFIGSGLEMLCIVNPRLSALDETEGFIADLLSTHPPLRKRLDILLGMARISISELDEKAKQRETTRKAAATTQPASIPRYYAVSPGQKWEGPFTFAELETLPWLSPLTWITDGEGRPVDRAWKDPAVNLIFASKLSRSEQSLSGFTCPSCGQRLVTTPCEGTQVFQCAFCSGTLVESGKIPRIIARRERPCTDRITALARTVLAQNQMRHARHQLAGKGKAAVPLLPCPKCKNPMFRGFYSMTHLVEVDRCSFCGLTWFDQDELEMLRCMIENRLASETTAPQ
jgi:heat shock protein HtpX